MSKESPTKKPRSTKKVTEESNTAELEAKIAELEAKLSNLSSQVQSESKPAPKPQPSTLRGTLPAGMKPQEKKSLWKAKGAEVAESYNAEGNTAPPPAPKPEPAKQRPAASGPTHGTLPAGMKPAPKPEPTTTGVESAGEVAPAYAKISSTGYTGNKYFATRKRLSYHPANKQFTGSSTTTTTAPPPVEPPKPKSTIRTTLPAGFKPSS